ncbi:hypothetical protein L2E82_30201 [Cichorium intybus]|uniref:Uncharacterized protein n=1 Tax=Cichorium intybus TaxID=13427 RepID=A0ACB9D019_CICIN|nr:hypothetical protein L2E82_30201 [Cichorium intybus]
MDTLPPKMKDLRAHLISLDLGDVHIKKALLDLALANKSTKIPRGMLSNVIIKVGDFYYSTYFLVLDTHDAIKEEQPTIIFGYPFLAIGNAHIDCRTGEIGISFGHQQSKINIFNDDGGTIEEQECYQVDIVDELVQQYMPEVLQTEAEEFSESVEEEQKGTEEERKEERQGYEECAQVDKLPS